MALTKTAAQLRAVLGKQTIATAKTITAATAATPIVVTSTAHGFLTGDTIAQHSVAGNLVANGVFVVTKIDANSYSLDGTVGTDAYTSGGSAIRVTSAMTPGDLEDLQYALSRIKHTHGADNNRAAESTVKALLGA